MTKSIWSAQADSHEDTIKRNVKLIQSNALSSKTTGIIRKPAKKEKKKDAKQNQTKLGKKSTLEANDLGELAKVEKKAKKEKSKAKSAEVNEISKDVYTDAKALDFLKEGKVPKVFNITKPDITHEERIRIEASQYITQKSKMKATNYNYIIGGPE